MFPIRTKTLQVASEWSRIDDVVLNRNILVSKFCPRNTVTFSRNFEFSPFYLRLKSFHQNGDQQVEQDVVTKGHQGNEIEGRPVTSLFHAVK